MDDSDSDAESDTYQFNRYDTQRHFIIDASWVDALCAKKNIIRSVIKRHNLRFFYRKAGYVFLHYCFYTLPRKARQPSEKKAAYTLGYHNCAKRKNCIILFGIYDWLPFSTTQQQINRISKERKRNPWKAKVSHSLSL